MKEFFPHPRPRSRRAIRTRADDASTATPSPSPRPRASSVARASPARASRRRRLALQHPPRVRFLVIVHKCVRSLCEAIFNGMWRNTCARPRGRAPNRVRSVGPSSARFLVVVARERGGVVRLVVVRLVVVPTVGRASASAVVGPSRGSRRAKHDVRARRGTTRAHARGGRRREVDA